MTHQLSRYTHETIALGFAITEEPEWFRDTIRGVGRNRQWIQFAPLDAVLPDRMRPHHVISPLACGIWSW